MLDRRSVLIGALALGAGCAGHPEEARRARADFRGLQAMLGPDGRLGVAALDTGTGGRLLHDENGRYAMASTFKWALAAMILADVDAGARRLSDEITFVEGDLLEYAPVARAHLARGRLTLEEACAAIVEVSDNTAANLLLRQVGGPERFTAFVRGAGDRETRLDRTETELNTNLPGDPRDTTTPAAMIGLMRALLLGDRLRPESRARLIGWMEGATTGLQRLRAGFPAGWRMGDKTGNGANGAANDLAIAYPPGRGPILVACYQSGGNAERPQRDAVHAAVARAVAAAFA